LTLVFLLIILALAGCGGGYLVVSPINFYTLEAEEVFAEQMLEIVFLELWLEVSNHVLAKHEPLHNTILGAYIKRDFAQNNIDSFQSFLGVEHGIFAHTMYLGDDYPLRWVLENIANFSAPHITLLPPEGEEVFDLELLEDFAIQAGIFDVPMFVQLFPITQDYNFYVAEYIAFFQQAHGIFGRLAPNVALVWGVYGENTAEGGRFFPGEDVVDWVQLTIYNETDAYGNFEDFFGILEPFYFEFNTALPIMVGTAVSHYSVTSNRYFSMRAADKITSIYEGVAERFPRVKALIYRNYNDLQGRGGMYRINSIGLLTQAYIDVATNTNFINSMQFEENFLGNILLRTPYQVMVRGHEFFVEGAFFGDDADGFVPMNEVMRRYGVDFFVNFAEGILVLKNLH